MEFLKGATHVMIDMLSKEELAEFYEALKKFQSENEKKVVKSSAVKGKPLVKTA